MRSAERGVEGKRTSVGIYINWICVSIQKVEHYTYVVPNTSCDIYKAETKLQLHGQLLSFLSIHL